MDSRNIGCVKCSHILSPVRAEITKWLSPVHRTPLYTVHLCTPYDADINGQKFSAPQIWYRLRMVKSCLCFLSTRLGSSPLIDSHSVQDRMGLINNRRFIVSWDTVYRKSVLYIILNNKGSHGITIHHNL